MKLISKISMFMAAVGVLMLSVGCTKDDVQQKPDQGKDPEKPLVPTIELSEDSVLLTKANLEATYQFKISDYTDGMPVIESTADWLTVQNVEKGESGANFQSFQFKMTAVLREGFSSAKVKVTYKDAEPKRVTVAQDNLPVAVILPMKSAGIHFTQEGGEVIYKIRILPYDEKEPLSVTSTADWVIVKDVKPIDTINGQDFQITVSAAANENPRNAALKINYRRRVQTVSVEQNNDPTPEISLSTENIRGSQSGQDFTINVKISHYNGGTLSFYCFEWLVDGVLTDMASIKDWLIVGDAVKAETQGDTQNFKVNLKLLKSDHINQVQLYIGYKNAPLKFVDINAEGFG